MSVARAVLSNTLWQIVGKIVWAILGIVSIKFVTNYLSPAEYGEYTTVYDYIALFAIVADFGLFTIAVREMAHEKEQRAIEKIVGNIFSIRIFLSVLALGLAVGVSYVMPAYKGTHIPGGVAIVAVATVLTLMAGTMSAVLQLYLRMYWASIALTMSKLITVGYIVFTIVYLFPRDPLVGFYHLLFSWIIGGIFNIAITYTATARLVKIRPQIDWTFWKSLFDKALPYGLALVLGTIYFRMGTITLSLFKMKEAAGFYGVPLRFLEILQIVPHYFMNSILPILIVALDTDRARAVRIMSYSIRALIALALPLLVGGYLLSWQLTAAVSSPLFLTRRVDGMIVWGSDVALKILVFGLAFTYLHVFMSYLLVALGRQREILKANLIAALVNVLLNIILAAQFGFIGVSITATVTEVIIFIILAFRIRSYLRDIFDVKFFLKTLFSAAVMGVALILVGPIIDKLFLTKGLFILIPLGMIVFGACMLSTKALSREMLVYLKKQRGTVVIE